MASLTVRDLSDEVKRKLRVRAASHGRSMEAEVRAILADAVAEPLAEEQSVGLGTQIRARFAEIEYADDLVQAIPPRTEMGRYADFGAD
jgi:plasmid stability protein